MSNRNRKTGIKNSAFVPKSGTSRISLRVTAFVLISIAGLATWAILHFVGADNSGNSTDEPVASGLLSTVADGPATIIAPGLGNRQFVGPLIDAYRRIDPLQDGWKSEAFSAAATDQLKKLGALLVSASRKEHPTGSKESFDKLVETSFRCRAIRPEKLHEVFRDQTFEIRRAEALSQALPTMLHGSDGLAQGLTQLASAFAGGIDRVKLKLFNVNPDTKHVATTVYFQAFGKGERSEGKQVSLQINATWKLGWSNPVGSAPRLESLVVTRHEEVRYLQTGSVLFHDCTETVLGETRCYRDQFLTSTDYWRSRIPRSLGLDVVGNHGIALGDVNGDHLDDIYVCQQGGLPNRLLIQNSDGTLRDATPDSGADWLDYCASALFIDLDNDGDRDLVVPLGMQVLIHSNDGHGRFQLVRRAEIKARASSLAAADYDNDGDLDLYICGYNPLAGTARGGAMGEPMPYYDANNGGRNTLLRNDGGFHFSDVTQQTGLEQNNSRYSLAVSWEDYDNDGDLDLYVANDYGRNCLFRNDRGRFVNVAPQLGVEDMSAGMSICWADYNHDGWMDIYVSNMFSAAGNRITFQRQFKSSIDPALRKAFQRHARGNTLFENDGKGGFRDVSQQAGVTMGRWAWGSRFVDLNGDGWDDLVVANGFISADDSGDL